MELMDNTACGDVLNPDGSSVYPGWKLAFSVDTHDLLLVDCYPDRQDKAKMIQDMENTWNKFVKIYPHEHQVIIQCIANGNNYWPGYIQTQYDFWKEKMASLEFNNPYKHNMGIAWYKQSLWVINEEMMDEMRIVANNG